jgi:hypothetical protein
VKCFLLLQPIQNSTKERDIRRLMIETENTIKVIKNLRIHTDKSINLKDIKELGVTYLGGAEEDSESINVYLSDKCQEAVFVHEILHIIMDYEGFPNIFINEVFVERNLRDFPSNTFKKIQAYFSSIIDHPEVFRRMESEYNLNIEEYYKIQFEQKERRFKRDKVPPSNGQFYFLRQQDILIGLDYFLWRDYGERLLELFRKYHPDAYSSCLSLFKKVSKLGFRTPEQTYQSAKEIQRHVINYGERKSLKKRYNDVWKAFEIRSAL